MNIILKHAKHNETAAVYKSDYKRIKDYNWIRIRGLNGPEAIGFKRDTTGHILDCQSMHRLILGVKHGDPVQVEHIDGNRLNNRRDNFHFYFWP